MANSAKHYRLGFLRVGIGGVHCPCCFPAPGKLRRAAYRRAKRRDRADAMKRAMTE